MTVCIAALAEHDKCIVAVSDNKVGFTDFSAENLAIKNIPFGGGDWTAMCAGNDISHADPILDHASDLLREGWAKQKTPKRRRHTPDPRAVIDALDNALNWRLQREIETSVLRPFGFTAETFRRQGRQQCTETQHAALCAKINQVDLGGLVFLLAGFDQRGIGHIWSVNGVSAPHNYDRSGMFAVGSGAWPALNTMAFHADAGHLRFRHSSVESVVYCALTAKFMAESASDVGKSTFAVVLRKKGDKATQFVKEPEVAVVRERWKNEGAPRFPTAFIVTELGSLIK
ncbi:MAG: hypothetical protein HYU37_05495 [Acidobacteria bacterium]|nr:hypothetical protein [Acidobacteriota bacterium]